MHIPAVYNDIRRIVGLRARISIIRKADDSWLAVSCIILFQESLWLCRQVLCCKGKGAALLKAFRLLLIKTCVVEWCQAVESVGDIRGCNAVAGLRCAGGGIGIVSLCSAGGGVGIVSLCSAGCGIAIVCLCSVGGSGRACSSIFIRDIRSVGAIGDNIVIC